MADSAHGASGTRVKTQTSLRANMADQQGASRTRARSPAAATAGARASKRVKLSADKDDEEKKAQLGKTMETRRAMLVVSTAPPDQLRQVKDEIVNTPQLRTRFDALQAIFVRRGFAPSDTKTRRLILSIMLEATNADLQALATKVITKPVGVFAHTFLARTKQRLLSRIGADSFGQTSVAALSIEDCLHSAVQKDQYFASPSLPQSVHHVVFEIFADLWKIVTSTRLSGQSVLLDTIDKTFVKFLEKFRIGAEVWEAHDGQNWDISDSISKLEQYYASGSNGTQSAGDKPYPGSRALLLKWKDQQTHDLEKGAFYFDMKHLKAYDDFAHMQRRMHDREVQQMADKAAGEKK